MGIIDAAQSQRADDFRKQNPDHTPVTTSRITTGDPSAG
jgi:hypothetical protein